MLPRVPYLAIRPLRLKREATETGTSGSMMRQSRESNESRTAGKFNWDEFPLRTPRLVLADGTRVQLSPDGEDCGHKEITHQLVAGIDLLPEI